MNNNNHICARCGKHQETTPSEYAWDVFCNSCFDEFKRHTLELAVVKKNLSDWQYDCQLRRIGREFCLDPESVRAYIWSFEDRLN